MSRRAIAPSFAIPTTSSGTRRSGTASARASPTIFRFPTTIGCVFAQWHDQAKLGDPSGKPPIAIRYRGGRLFFTGAYGRVASPEPDIRYEFAQRRGFSARRLARFRLPRFLVAPRRFGDRGLARTAKRVIDWRGPLAYENEVEGPYFKLGALLVAGRAEADRRLSRQLQPRAFLRGGRSVGRARSAQMRWLSAARARLRRASRWRAGDCRTAPIASARRRALSQLGHGDFAASSTPIGSATSRRHRPRRALDARDRARRVAAKNSTGCSR